MERFYSPYHRSIHALYALLCGEFPNPGPLGITLLNPRIDCDEWSTVFARAGVTSGFFHGGYFSFYDKTQFLSDRDYAELKDATAIGDDDTARSEWGVDDRETVRDALEWIDALSPDQRFAMVLVPITAHYPFEVPPDVERPFGTSRKIDRFLNAVHFLDIVFDELMTGLEKRGLMKDTVVLFTADHGESPYEPPRVSNVDRAAYEYDVRVPAVLFSDGMFPVPASSSRLASVADILPTMLDAAGSEDRPRQGQSILAGAAHLPRCGALELPPARVHRRL
jgi:phosphoglycerol transferase MdoB-like AlkP superfamily enzyme